MVNLKLSVLLMSKFYVMLPQDFRLRDISEYEEWYGQAHRAPDLQVVNSVNSHQFLRFFYTKKYSLLFECGVHMPFGNGTM